MRRGACSGGPHAARSGSLSQATPCPSDFAAVALSSVCCTLAGCLLFATNIWWDLSINFDVAPWRAGQDGALTVTPGGADSTPLECPFYRSENPEAQCCACGTLVSRSGLHEARQA